MFDIVRWFLFDLLILGYVEDRNSGLSFRLPGELKWTFYIEVPCGSLVQDAKEALNLFCEEIPLFNILGSPLLISDEIPFSVTKDVQLVCKYLKAYEDGRIDTLITEEDEDIKEGIFNINLYSISILNVKSTDHLYIDENCLNHLHVDATSKQYPAKY